MQIKLDFTMTRMVNPLIMVSEEEEPMQHEISMYTPDFSCTFWLTIQTFTIPLEYFFRDLLRINCLSTEHIAYYFLSLSRSKV